MDDPIDSRQMQVFIALAHGGSLKAAASELLITESAISHAVRNLEKNLGTKLFYRAGKGLALTENGRIFLREAVRIISRMRDLRGSLAIEDNTGGNEIRIVAATSFIRFELTDILREFSNCFPDVSISVTAADRDTCLELLNKGEANAAILVNLPEGSKDYKGVHIFSDQLQVLMSKNHRLASLSELPVHALSREKVYLQSRNNFTSRMIENEIARWSFQLRNKTYISSYEALRELTKSGLGITFQSRWAFREDWDEEFFAWRPVPTLDLNRKWYFAWPSDSKNDIKMRTLMRLCESAGQRIEQQRNYELAGKAY